MIGFQNPEENGKWKVPVAMAGQIYSGPNRQAEGGQFGIVAEITPSTRNSFVRMDEADTGDKE